MKLKIKLIEEIDLIDDCNLADWGCEYSLDGEKTWLDGYMQSDGHLVAEETLHDVDGNPVIFSAPPEPAKSGRRE